MSGMGRPRKHIDWNQVANLISYGNTKNQIAHFFHTTKDTLDDAAKRDLGETFSAFFARHKSIGKSNLRMSVIDHVHSGRVGWANAAKMLMEKWKPTDWDDEDEGPDQASNQGPKIEMPVKKTFTQFCIDASYPAPFEKQIEMKDFGFNNELPRVLLGARGYGKTDYLTIMGTAYEIYSNWWDHKYLGHPLNETNLIITKSKSRNTAMIEEIANALEANGVPLAKRNSSVIKVEGLIGKDASAEAITIKTSMRGRHPKRVLMDDPVTEEDVSDAMRKLVERKYNEVLKLCSNVCVIGQPAHKHDLYAKLRGIIKKLEVPHGTIPELDHDLEAQRLAGVDENSIKMSYFLEVPNDGTTPFDQIKKLDYFPKEGTAVAFIDPSHEGGDYTAISIIKQHMQGVAVVGFTFKKAWNHCLEELVTVINKYGVAKLAFETNALGDQPIIMLRQLLANTGVGVIGRRSNSNKHSRIMAAGSYAHIIHLSLESDKKYQNQVIEYEYKAKNDDAPDSLASCLEWIGLIQGKV